MPGEVPGEVVLAVRSFYKSRIVASPSIVPILTTSVAVVRNIVEAVAGMVDQVLEHLQASGSETHYLDAAAQFAEIEIEVPFANSSHPAHPRVWTNNLNP